MSNESADKKRAAKPGPDDREDAAAANDVEGEPAASADDTARERDEYLDNWKRERASFLNYKRWVENERRNWEAAAACRLVEKLLPFIDDVDRALLAANEATEVESLREGFRLIAKSFEEALGRAGVEEIPSNGEAFDPRMHEAVFQVEDPNQPHGTVTDTTQRGFRMGDRLIRASKVVVSRAPEPPVEGPGPDERSETPSDDEDPGPDADASRGPNEEG